MFRALILGVLAFCFSTAIGRPVVSYLRDHNVGKRIKEEGPSSHAVKEGTPTMGGLLIFGTVVVLTVPFNLIDRLSILLPYGMIGATGAVGFVDDLATVVGSSRQGVTWRFKLVMLLALSIIAGWVLWGPLGIHHVRIPWAGRHDVGLLIIPIAIAVIIGTTSAVAITDGLDGLAGGTSAFAFAAYGIIAAFQGQPFIGAFCFTVVGAVLGFLWYNAYPARVFMGDTGALALGSSLAVVTLMTEQWLVLPVVGIVFVLEAASDLLQIAYFKLTRGRRLFRMTPLHHHFELLGWPETRVVARLWLIGIAGAMAGVALALKV